MNNWSYLLKFLSDRDSLESNNEMFLNRFKMIEMRQLISTSTNIETSSKICSLTLYLYCKLHS